MSYPGQQFEPPEKKAIVLKTGLKCYVLEFMEKTDADLNLWVVIFSFSGTITIVNANELNFEI